MKRLVVVFATAVLATGCTATHSPNPAPIALTEADLAVAGWRMPFECLEISERLEASQARLHESSTGAFSTARATDERRVRALESRADELGCLLPGSPYTY